MEIRGRIARKTFRLTFPSDTEIPEHWKRFFGAHAVRGPGPEVDADLHLTPRPGWSHAPERQGVFQNGEEGEVSYRVVRHDMKGELRQIGGRLAGSFEVNSDDATPISMTLKVALSLLCEARGELLMHASAVRRNGHVWIFSGPSGSGKSTIAEELAKGGDVLALDNAVVYIGPDGLPLVDSTPFSDSRRLAKSAEGEPIAAISFINQASRVEMFPLGTHDAVLSLLRESLVFSGEDGRFDRIMGVVGAIADAGVCRRMEFTRDESFWDMLDVIDHGEKRG